MSDPVVARLTAALADRYRIEREIGQGGMATVYLAEDVRHRRKVAVKVLRPELAATLGSDRFFREIEVAAQLQHPHILPLLDSGEVEGFYYYVMPYVVGESLRERLVKVGELPIHDAVKILCEIVDALAAAHSLGVVHRDIKPDNVMLSGRHALVTDFGVAKAVSEATGRNKLTSAGVALGTPAYMAPEQAAADPHLDHRVDIYAVGVLGYELLTGRPPFPGLTAQETLAAQVTQRPEQLIVRRPACPPALAAVIMKCLEKRPADRFQTAEELLAQLEPLATPSGGMTPTQSRPVEAFQAMPANKAVWALGAVVLVAVLTVVTTWRLASHRTRVAAVLRDHVQLTSTGRVSYPAISPDGKQLAYVVTDCGGSTCKYGIELKDVGGTATQRLFDKATALYGIAWSPDRRSLRFNGTVGDRYGAYLISVLGGVPRLITDGSAVFWAGGDSLLVTPTVGSDSVFWVRVTGLDGVRRDSIRVAGPAQSMGVLGTIPNSPWVIVWLGQLPNLEFRAIDRHGRIGDRLTIRGTGFNARTAADAMWIQIYQAGANPRPAIVRVPFDPRTGRFSDRMDTLYTGPVTQFDVTADGGSLVLDEGTNEFSVWALDLHDGLRGVFPENRRLLHSTTPVNGVTISSEGEWVIVWRSEEASVAASQLTKAPFETGAEIPLPVSGSLVAVNWSADPEELALAEKTPAGLQFVLTDLRTGTRRPAFIVPDSTLIGFTPLPDDGWAWIPPAARSIRIQRQGESAPQTLAIPDWYLNAFMLDATPDGRAVAFLGWDAATSDSIGLSVMDLSEGKATPWVTVSGENALLHWLPDGSILLGLEVPGDCDSLPRIGPRSDGQPWHGPAAGHVYLRLKGSPPVSGRDARLPWRRVDQQGRAAIGASDTSDALMTFRGPRVVSFVVILVQFSSIFRHRVTTPMPRTSRSCYSLS